MVEQSSLASETEDSNSVPQNSSNDVFLLPASFSQQRMWFLHRWNPGSAAYNVPASYRLSGNLDVSALARAFDEIVRRHEILRTSFISQDGMLMQQILPAASCDFAVVSAPSSQNLEAQINAFVSQEILWPFQLDSGPLLRVRVLRLAPSDHVLCVVMHHIITDGGSLQVLFKELRSLYAAFSSGVSDDLEDLPIQYGDFAVWQRERLQEEELGKQLHYWKNQLAGMPPLELPLDRPRPRQQTTNGSIRKLSFGAELTGALKALSSAHKSTLFMTLAAAFQILLQRHSGQNDIAIGLPISGRVRPETEALIGLFANTIVLRGDLSADPSFIELLNRVRKAALDGYAHQDVPFEKLVEELQPQRDLSRSPLFQVLFAMQNLTSATPDLLGLTVSQASGDWRTAKFELSLYLDEVAGKLEGFFEFNTDLFEPQTIDRLAERFAVLLADIAAHPDKRISQLAVLTGFERTQLLFDWNRTQAPYQQHATIIHLFEDQVLRTPEAIAVSMGADALTYRELNQRADVFAADLRQRGVAPGGLIGICIERSVEMVCAVLGVLKTGSAYVPLDPGFPADRLAFMISDAGLSSIVTQRDLMHLVGESSCPKLVLEELASRRLPTNVAADRTPEADDLAYVLYTSGSTGKPKGVEISHRALTNFLCAMRTQPGCRAGDVLLSVTTLSFDIAGLELYLPLITGARVEIAPRATTSDGPALRRLMEQCSPTIMQATPATWRMLIASGWKGSDELVALCGGEALPRELAAELIERTGQLWNMYGPTETTIWSSVQRISDPDEEISIGKPIANTFFYVLDASLQPVPIGVPGELFIAGDGVARGYRNRPDLTAERFLIDPFEGTNAKMYRTGDLVRYLPDGRLVHLGRMDSQIKLRGFRIELEEIETVLSQHGSVTQAAAVLTQSAGNEPVLVAYVVNAPGQTFSGADLRQHLRVRLPEYMVPQRLVALPSLPLTPNGKIDRKQLRGLTLEPSAAVDYIAPRSPEEQALAEIWSVVLGIEKIGVHDDFFELGGHSLGAVQVTAKIAERFKIDVPVQAVFEAPTIERLAERMSELLPSPMRAGAEQSGLAAESLSRLTSTQRRLRTIWERALQRAPIYLHDDFFQLGGGKDEVEWMLEQVRLSFGIFAEGLPVSEFTAKPTIATLARMLDNAAEHTSKLVVCLQPHGTKPPLFLIHAAGGYVFFYRALAFQLGPHRPVYGIRAQTRADGSGGFHECESVEALAAKYIKEMKTVRPHGPYCLGGGCFGGVIAFEMARQLKASGDEVVGPVLLFDAFVDNNRVTAEHRLLPPRTQLEYMQKRMDVHIRHASRLGRRAGLKYVSRKLLSNATDTVTLLPALVRAAGVRAKHWLVNLADDLQWWVLKALGKRPMPTERAQKLMLDRFLMTADRLLGKYKPDVYDGRLVLFKAAKSLDAEPFWAGLGRQGISSYTMPGRHLDMMEEPAVSTTAALVAKCLDSESESRS